MTDVRRFKIGSRPADPDPEVLALLAGCAVATLGHLTDFGFPRGLRPLVRTGPFAGPALTVRIPHLDSTAVHEAMAHVRPGDVVVIDQSGDQERSSFGGTLAAIAHDAGAIAAVCDGRTNDVAEIEALGFPVYSRGRTPLTTRILGLEGEINTPVSIGGVAVSPGDIVFGDDDGVAVIRADDAATVARRLHELEIDVTGRRFRERSRDGEPFGTITGAHAAMMRATHV